MRIGRSEVIVRADNRHGFVDLTDELERVVERSGITDGYAIAFCTHTTATLMINEWEDGTLEDLRARLRELIPHDVYYRHDDLSCRTQNLRGGPEPANGAAHVTQMILGGASLAIPVAANKPLFGRWQRLFMVELDEPRDRTIVFFVMGVRTGSALPP
ncbi:MAG: secondary thiamine-phosphate synthase enzyme YjbQ [Actinomycetota bacterium]